MSIESLMDDERTGGDVGRACDAWCGKAVADEVCSEHVAPRSIGRALKVRAARFAEHEAHDETDDVAPTR